MLLFTSLPLSGFDTSPSKLSFIESLLAMLILDSECFLSFLFPVRIEKVNQSLLRPVDLHLHVFILLIKTKLLAVKENNESIRLLVDSGLLL